MKPFKLFFCYMITIAKLILAEDENIVEKGGDCKFINLLKGREESYDCCNDNGIFCSIYNDDHYHIDQIRIICFDNEEYTFPDSFGHIPHISDLIIDSCNFNGTIPEDIGNLTTLINIQITNNNITSYIPTSIGSLTNLKVLELDGNRLHGSIPPEIENMSQLQKLSLNHNQLDGSIPPEIKGLSELNYLSLDYNQLSGSIPPEIGNLNNLNKLSLNHNQLTDSIPPEIAKLTELKHLSVNYNQLNGSIPPEIGDLTKLEHLSLEYNQLTGSIPLEIGNLTRLKYLYLSHNKLSGEIPTKELEKLNLYEIDLEGNENLSGNIPVLGNNDTISRKKILNYESSYYNKCTEYYCKDNICKSVNYCHTFHDIFKIPDKNGEIVNYVIDNKKFYITDGKRCEYDSQCSSNKCINSHCIVKEDSSIESCLEIYEYSCFSGRQVHIHCGKPEGQECKSDKECSTENCSENKCIARSNDGPGENEGAICGMIFAISLVGITLLITIITCSACCAYFYRRNGKEELSPARNNAYLLILLFIVIDVIFQAINLHQRIDLIISIWWCLIQFFCSCIIMLNTLNVLCHFNKFWHSTWITFLICLKIVIFYIISDLRPNSFYIISGIAICNIILIIISIHYAIKLNKY